MGLIMLPFVPQGFLKSDYDRIEIVLDLVLPIVAFDLKSDYDRIEMEVCSLATTRDDFLKSDYDRIEIEG